MNYDEIKKWLEDNNYQNSGLRTDRNYRIDLYLSDVLHDFAQQQVKNLTIPHVINSATAQMIHYDLAIKANELMKQHDTMKVEDFRELPEVKRLWNAMDVIKEHYL